MGERNTIVLSTTDRALRAAAGMLARGDLVALPTETVYGLGADARQARPVAEIFAAKGRPQFNPLIVHVADATSAARLVTFEPAATALAEALWPGPLTLVLPRRDGGGIADLVAAGLNTLAVRVPAHPVATRLLALFGGPIAAPSANPSGRLSPTTAAHVLASMRGRVDAVIDAGPTPVGLESTVVGFSAGVPVILRPGGVTAAQIQEVLGVKPTTPAAGSPVQSPGQLAAHYAPRAPLRLAATNPKPGELWLGFGPMDGRRGLTLSASRNLVEAAANLFEYLHRLDEQAGPAGIAVAEIPEDGLGIAINDRLRRAATP